MTRKDYVLIADAIRSVMDAKGADQMTVRAVAEQLGFALQNDSPRFSMATFKAACGDHVLNFSGRSIVSRLDDRPVKLEA